MAKIKDSTNKTKPRSSCSLGCFGFSDKEQQPPDMVQSGSQKKICWFSWSRFRMKKSAYKTVPVNFTASGKLNRTREIHALKSEKKDSSKRHRTPAARISRSQIPAAVPVVQIRNDKPQKTRYEDAENIILENNESLDPVDSVKDDTSQKGLRPSRRKREGKRAGVNQPSWPEIQSKSGEANAGLSKSASFPQPKPKKQATTAGGGEDKPHQESDTFAGKFDPVVGMSIIMVTLIIMLLWGKLCAILCTSAWLYFVPRLRKVPESQVTVKNGSNPSQPDLMSEEYKKKKVVLEGFLERNHRHGNGIL